MSDKVISRLSLKRAALMSMPAVQPVAELLAGEFDRVVRRAALQLGFSEREAEEIYRVTAAGAIRSFSSAVAQVNVDRKFGGRP